MKIKKIETFQGTNEQAISLLMSKVNALIGEIDKLNNQEEMSANLEYLVREYGKVNKNYQTGINEAFWAEGTQNKRLYRDVLQVLNLLNLFVNYYERKNRNDEGN